MVYATHASHVTAVASGTPKLAKYSTVSQFGLGQQQGIWCSLANMCLERLSPQNASAADTHVRSNDRKQCTHRHAVSGDHACVLPGRSNMSVQTAQMAT